ncbi:hypothetical protein SDRG_13205 [Saprolegnia diclina VS20]|uniref:Uncharacterized protein n=1 Tax=Saprolegnia diclina (strain VS20) TaxID=1156394 RepID=T0Q6H4_SAPDV|nr:hypothetical protein SDRG_13205 [Saprolegnia diclina VS20]EQC29050.1 hypothetical protein SDRG_13205 [Saprolegnia diclina VS20]|eukprot:XP_008617509.1 hypothetical protein SDRG_13205 [Saprolegnia diclina VS20]
MLGKKGPTELSLPRLDDRAKQHKNLKIIEQFLTAENSRELQLAQCKSREKRVLMEKEFAYQRHEESLLLDRLLHDAPPSFQDVEDDVNKMLEANKLRLESISTHKALPYKATRGGRGRPIKQPKKYGKPIKKRVAAKKPVPLIMPSLSNPTLPGAAFEGRAKTPVKRSASRVTINESDALPTFMDAYLSPDRIVVTATEHSKDVVLDVDGYQVIVHRKEVSDRPYTVGISSLRTMRSPSKPESLVADTEAALESIQLVAIEERNQVPSREAPPPTARDVEGETQALQDTELREDTASAVEPKANANEDTEVIVHERPEVAVSEGNLAPDADERTALPEPELLLADSPSDEYAGETFVIGSDSPVADSTLDEPPVTMLDTAEDIGSSSTLETTLGEQSLPATTGVETAVESDIGDADAPVIDSSELEAATSSGSEELASVFCDDAATTTPEALAEVHSGAATLPPPEPEPAGAVEPAPVFLSTVDMPLEPPSTLPEAIASEVELPTREDSGSIDGAPSDLTPSEPSTPEGSDVVEPDRSCTDVDTTAAAPDENREPPAGDTALPPTGAENEPSDIEKETAISDDRSPPCDKPAPSESTSESQQATSETTSCDETRPTSTSGSDDSASTTVQNDVVDPLQSAASMVLQRHYRGHVGRKHFQRTLYTEAQACGVLGAMPGTVQGATGWYQEPKTHVAHYFVVLATGEWKHKVKLHCRQPILTKYEMRKFVTSTIDVMDDT